MTAAIRSMSLPLFFFLKSSMSLVSFQISVTLYFTVRAAVKDVPDAFGRRRDVLYYVHSMIGMEMSGEKNRENAL
jgi:hypothetical protein